MPLENIFLDTNILIDLFNDRRSKHNEALKFHIAQIFDDVNLWASATSFTDIFYILCKNQSLSNEIQDVFLEASKYINICSLDSVDVVNAAKKKWLDFEDCIINESAEKVGADCIISEDVNGFSQSSIPVYSIEDYFIHLKEKYDIEYEQIEFNFDEEID